MPYLINISFYCSLFTSIPLKIRVKKVKGALNLALRNKNHKFVFIATDTTFQVQILLSLLAHEFIKSFRNKLSTSCHRKPQIEVFFHFP